MDNYEKKIREFLNSSEVDQLYKSMLLNLFPEFRESEDERTRKELIQYIKDHPAAPEGHIEKRVLSRWIAWLEKQKERSPVWSEDDEKMLSDIIKDLVHPWNEYIPDRIEDEIKWLKNRLKSLKPQNRWKPSLSQLNALGVVTKGNAPDDIEEINSLYNDLKKLM